MRTEYDGPTTVSTFSFGDHAVKLVRPAEPDRLLNDAKVFELNRDDDYMPYWAYLWPGAFLLAEAVARENWGPNMEALEIGCGLGLAGLAALIAGIDRVQFTDYDETPLQFVERSAMTNEIDSNRFSTRFLDWRDLPDERFDVILGADVLYERRLVPLVVNLISRMLKPEGVALIAGPYRVASDEELSPCLSRHRLTAETTAIDSHDERGHSVSGTLYRVRFRLRMTDRLSEFGQPR